MGFLNGTMISSRALIPELVDSDRVAASMGYIGGAVC